MEDLTISDIQKSWTQKFYSKEEWPAYKRLLLKMPEKLGALGTKYYQSLCDNILSMDLSQQYDFDQAVSFFNSLLLLRKTDCIIKCFKTVEKTQLHYNLISKFDPISVFLMALFKNLGFSEFCSFFEQLPKESEDFLCFHLPFKIHSVDDVHKLTGILKKYSLGLKSLEVVVKAWSDKMFLINSLWHNKPITAFIHDLMEKNLPTSVTIVMYQGIQERLSSNNKDISLSGLLIASRVAQLLESDEIIKFTLEDYCNGRDLSDHGEIEEEDSNEGVQKKTVYLEEVLNGLISNDRDRFKQALSSAGSLIMEDLAELDIHLESLAKLFLVLENKFNISGFEDYRFVSLTNLTVLRPESMIVTLTERIKSNYTIGDIIVVMDVIKEASKRLANSGEEVKITGKKIESKYKVIHDRLEKKTKRFFTKKKPEIKTKNLFLPHFPLFCGKILEKIDWKIGFMGLSKIFYTLSELVDKTGGTCDYSVVQQCVFIIKNVVKVYITHEKREVVEAVIYLLINISYKLDGSSLLSEFDSVLGDLSEIAGKLEKVCPELQDLATKAYLLIAYHG